MGDACVGGLLSMASHLDRGKGSEEEMGHSKDAIELVG